MERRAFLKLIGGAAAGVTAVAAADVLGFGQPAEAAPRNRRRRPDPGGHDHGSGSGSPTRVVDSFRYKRRRVQVVSRDGGLYLRIDGKELDHHFFMQEGEAFRSHLLPYRLEATPRAMAMAIIDEDQALYRL